MSTEHPMLPEEIDILDAFFNSKPNSIVFEWGCGESTLRWGPMVKKWLSIESNTKRFNEINTIIENDDKYLNTHILYTTVDFYARMIELQRKSDIIIVNDTQREECLEAAFRLAFKPVIIIEHDYIKAAPYKMTDKYQTIHYEVHNGVQKTGSKGIRFYNVFEKQGA